MTPLRRKLIEAEAMARDHADVLSEFEQDLVRRLVDHGRGRPRPTATLEEERVLDEAIAAMTAARKAVLL